MKSSARSSEPTVEAFRAALLAWYRKNRRKLPWREEPSLYKTVVSEFMLQQTQVKTVLPYFARWHETLPDFESLAKAPEQQVLKLWEGLGYYSRARNLQKLAREYCALPRPPRLAEEWREMPGVGPYTAAAIASIAFGQPVACVDGNVVRIIARLEADPRDFRDGVSAAKAFSPRAAELVDPRNPGDYNQAMMELGATLCSRSSPQCLLCPVSAWCKARMQGEPERFPHLASKSMEKKLILRGWCLQGGKLLLHQHSTQARRLAAIYELPSNEHLGLGEATLRAAPLLATKRRGITRYQITESIHRLETPPKPLPAGLSWVSLDTIGGIVLSGPHRKWLPELIIANAR
jgi:A/G-specific adenine glycosylase